VALIDCIECNKEISDKSMACIHCGCPIQSKALNTPVLEVVSETSDYDNFYYPIVINRKTLDLLYLVLKNVKNEKTKIGIYAQDSIVSEMKMITGEDCQGVWKVHFKYVSMMYEVYIRNGRDAAMQLKKEWIKQNESENKKNKTQEQSVISLDTTYVSGLPFPASSKCNISIKQNEYIFSSSNQRYKISEENIIDVFTQSANKVKPENFTASSVMQAQGGLLNDFGSIAMLIDNVHLIIVYKDGANVKNIIFNLGFSENKAKHIKNYFVKYNYKGVLSAYAL